MMENVRFHGIRPYTTAVLHGGPGAPGEVAPVARRLARAAGVLEPLQTASSVDGQVEELRAAIESHANIPVILIGWSWGAILAFITASRYHRLVKKLILLSSAPFLDKYADNIMQTRLSRLSEDERAELQKIMKEHESSDADRSRRIFARFGELMSKADSYDALDLEDEVVEYQPEINQSVWSEASRLRKSGALVEMALKIRCPVTAIHGDYDPHPWQGVSEPLSPVLKSFHMTVLEKCGHTLWAERHAADRFYQILQSEVLDTQGAISAAESL